MLFVQQAWLTLVELFPNIKRDGVLLFWKIRNKRGLLLFLTCGYKTHSKHATAIIVSACESELNSKAPALGSPVSTFQTHECARGGGVWSEAVLLHPLHAFHGLLS